MDSPEKIPLQEAMARGLIPCGACGGNGASPESLGGKRHFVCPPCARRLRRRVWLVGALALVAAGAAAFFIFRKPEDPADKARAQLALYLEEVKGLIRDQKFREALERLNGAPAVPDITVLAGYCFQRLGYYEKGLPVWHEMARNPATEEMGRVGVGRAYAQIGHSAAGLPHLERPVRDSDLDHERRQALAACLMDLERFDEALRVLDEGPKPVRDPRLRFRILTFLGREEEARKLLESLDVESSPEARAVRVQLRAFQLREAGDFAGSLRTIRESLEKSDSDFLRRSSLATYLESGDLEGLRAQTEALAKGPSALRTAEALWYRMIAFLAEGRRDDAVVAAKEGLEKSDRDLAALRQKVLMFQNLLGQRTDEEVEKEAKSVNRLTANDLYYYLALATGKKEWGERALQSTVGRDLPYFSIRRLLGK